MCGAGAFSLPGIGTARQLSSAYHLIWPMNRFLFNHSIWPSNQKHPASFWLANSKIEYIPRTLEDQMLKKALTRQVPQTFFFFFSFNELLSNEGDPAASYCTGYWTHTLLDSSRLQLNIKASVVRIYLRLIHWLVPMRNKLDCMVKWKKHGRQEGWMMCIR